MKTNMQRYVGTKFVNAFPLSRLEWLVFRNLPVDQEGENIEEEGYLVEYTDGGKPNTAQYKGYVSWSPKDVFERSYRPIGGSGPNFDRQIIEMAGAAPWLGDNIPLSPEELYKSTFLRRMYDRFSSNYSKIYPDGKMPRAMGLPKVLKVLAAGTPVCRTNHRGALMVFSLADIDTVSSQAGVDFQQWPFVTSDGQVLMVHEWPDHEPKVYIPSACGVFAINYGVLYSEVMDHE